MTKQAVLNSDPAAYTAAENMLKNELKTMGNNANWYCNSFNPYPIAISPQDFHHHQLLQSCLHRAITAVVANYAADERLQRLLSVPEPVASRLEQLQSEYKIGSYRPDFVHDTNCSIKICEINARFPTNGYYISHYLGQCIPRLTYIPSSVQPLQGMGSIPDTLLSRFKPGSNISILKGREKGWDIHFFKRELAMRGYSIKELAPEGSHMTGAHDGYVLELHQDELTNRLDVISRMTDSTPGFNDLRTIFLVHDKRLLAVFHDESIMKDYVSEDDIITLKDNVAESHVISCAPNFVKSARANKQEWVLKPNLLGKGEGMVIGVNVTQTEWERALDNPSHSEFILQRFVEQRKWSIMLRINDCVSEALLNVVGTLLCFDEHFLGTGIYRASQDDIVNVAGGGAILFPMLSDEQHTK